jgi:hypothetical protein
MIREVLTILGCEMYLFLAGSTNLHVVTSRETVVLLRLYSFKIGCCKCGIHECWWLHVTRFLCEISSFDCSDYEDCCFLGFDAVCFCFVYSTTLLYLHLYSGNGKVHLYEAGYVYTLCRQPNERKVLCK